MSLVALGVGGGRFLVWQDRAEGEPIGSGLLRAGVPRGAEVRKVERHRTKLARALVRKVERLDARDVWYRTGPELAAWARRPGGGWGAIDGAPFDRDLVKRTLWVFEWSVGPRWATISESDGGCLVLRGERGRRLLVMSGVLGTPCTGRALVGGVRQ